jgi:predicted GNAT family acetyltransferase
MKGPDMEHVLDNVVWHALSGPHRALAIGHGRARHYPRDVAPFSAIADSTPLAYADLAADLPLGAEARLFRPTAEALPAGWAETGVFPMLQMVAGRAPGEADRGIQPVRLGPADVPHMLELAEISQPGPFAVRTVELGAYRGVRHEGKLVAMAGERMRVPGYVELSAICSHPVARGHGHAALLTRALMRAAFDRGKLPFLHVRPDNVRAVALYEALGFALRRELVVLWRRPMASS